MGFKVDTLWQEPEINPVNGKARSIPILNPINKYGRVFVSGLRALSHADVGADMSFLLEPLTCPNICLAQY